MRLDFCEAALEASLTWLREIIDLASGGGKRFSDRRLHMFVPAVVRRRVIDNDVFVRWNCQRDVDLEAGAVTVFMARRDHSHATSDDVTIVLFQSFDFAFDRSARSLRRIASFKSHL
jgi:hypothetical protein